MIAAFTLVLANPEFWNFL